MAEDTYSTQDEVIKNPIYADDVFLQAQKYPEQPDKMKIIMILLQALLVFMVGLVLILTVVILAVPSSCDTSQPLTSTSTNCSTMNNVSCIGMEQMSVAITRLIQAAQNISTDIDGVKMIDTELLKSFSDYLLVAQNISSSVDDVNSFVKNEQTSYNQNTTNILKDVLEAYENSTTLFNSLINSISIIKNIDQISAAVVNDLLLAVEQLADLQNKTLLINSLQAISCKDIKAAQPSSGTGYFFINGRNIFCNMDELCGSGGGWTRLGYLDMADATENCPPQFGLYTSGGVRACGRSSPSSASCTPSLKFQTYGFSYSQICGRVTGYQYDSPDGVDTRLISAADHNNINSFYVDGVSITRGSPRKHVWTLMGGVYDSHYDDGNCVCNTPPGARQQVQSFVGTNYFCESGNPNTNFMTQLYTADPLWDGQGCGTQESTCCSASGLPWFHRDYGNMTTTDFIELRVCGDEGNEDTPISFFEIYVK